MNEIFTHQQLYKTVSFASGKMLTQAYSTSFSLALRSLEKDCRNAIYAIYGFVRLADEIVDTFQNHKHLNLLDNFIGDTYMAIDEGISTNLVLNAFQDVVKTYDIDQELIRAFFFSMAMAMDIEERTYDEQSYKTYIYGSAQVVGLMCLKVFVKGDRSLYNKLKEPAASLGAAFQKINFLRDIKSDFQDRGRIYFPSLEKVNFCLTNEIKMQIEKEITFDLMQAKKGIDQLPSTSKRGVKLAYVYFKSLLGKIVSSDADQILKGRTRVSNFKKFIIFVTTW